MSLPASSPSPLTIGGSRRLSSRRRGSIAAPDPFGTYPDNDRGMSSTLHIVKALPLTGEPEEIPRQRLSNGPRARSHSGGSNPNAGRMSFAFSGFTPLSFQKDSSMPPRSNNTERARSVSPLSKRPIPLRSNSFTTLPTAYTSLTPLQVYNMAQQCTYPNTQSTTPGREVSALSTPVSFTPLPDAHYLPYLDRPGEVQTLISTPPTCRLFLLLAQTLPSTHTLGNDTDPALWSYKQLERWLTKVGRDEADDVEWVKKAGTCISTRSELIWERIKAALGVPPELDGLYEDVDPQDDSNSEGSVHEGCPAGIEYFTDSFGDARVEPIVSSSASSSPIPSPCSPTFQRSPSLVRQNVSRMEDISEDAAVPPSVPTVHGLRVVTEPQVRRRSLPSPTSAGSFSHPHAPYDAVAERGPGHPLFPSSFANLALGPTLIANNPSLRYPPAPPASAYPLSRSRRRAPSWAEGWDLQKQEYAVSVASGSSRRSIIVD